MQNSFAVTPRSPAGLVSTMPPHVLSYVLSTSKLENTPTACPTGRELKGAFRLRNSEIAPSNIPAPVHLSNSPTYRYANIIPQSSFNVNKIQHITPYKCRAFMWFLFVFISGFYLFSQSTHFFLLTIQIPSVILIVIRILVAAHQT